MTPREGTPAQGEETEAQGQRRVWALNLNTALRARDLTARDFRTLLFIAGVDVSQQAVYSWLSGQFAPNPEHRRAVAVVLDQPEGVLFPGGAPAVRGRAA